MQPKEWCIGHHNFCIASVSVCPVSILTGPSRDEEPRQWASPHLRGKHTRFESATTVSLALNLVIGRELPARPLAGPKEIRHRRTIAGNFVVKHKISSFEIDLRGCRFEDRSPIAIATISRTAKPATAPILRKSNIYAILVLAPNFS
jgi:hypothetical protein